VGDYFTEKNRDTNMGNLRNLKKINVQTSEGGGGPTSTTFTSRNTICFNSVRLTFFCTIITIQILTLDIIDSLSYFSNNT
jgi:hypothetical protein